MNKLEISKLLASVSTFDNRKIAMETVEAWYLALGDLDYEESSEAIVIHFRETTDWLMPAHIRRNVSRIQDRKARIERMKRPRIESKAFDYDFDREEHERMVREFAQLQIEEGK